MAAWSYETRIDIDIVFCWRRGLESWKVDRLMVTCILEVLLHDATPVGEIIAKEFASFVIPSILFFLPFVLLYDQLQLLSDSFQYKCWIYLGLVFHGQ